MSTIIVALAGVHVHPLDDSLGAEAGALLARVGAGDVIGAAVMLLATDGDEILTSDPDDLAALAEASGAHTDLITV